MLRCALFGVAVIAVAGCASTAGDISWTARYITPFEKVTKCLAAPSSDAYSVSAETYIRGGTASVTMVRRDQPAMMGVYTIQQAAPDATDVTKYAFMVHEGPDSNPGMRIGCGLVNKQ